MIECQQNIPNKINESILSNLSNQIFNIYDICNLILRNYTYFDPRIIPYSINKVFYISYKDTYKYHLKNPKFDYQGNNLQLFNNNKNIKNIKGHTINDIVNFGPYLITSYNYKIIIKTSITTDIQNFHGSIYIGFTTNYNSEKYSLIGVCYVIKGKSCSIEFKDHNCLNGYSGPYIFESDKSNYSNDQYFELLIYNKKPMICKQGETPQNIQLYQNNRTGNPKYDIKLPNITRLWTAMYWTDTNCELVSIDII